MCNNKVVKLSDLPVGSFGEIVEIEETPLKDRLIELGFTVGSKIGVLHFSLGGSAVACLVKGAVIALRVEDSAHIYILEDNYA